MGCIVGAALEYGDCLVSAGGFYGKDVSRRAS